MKRYHTLDGLRGMAALAVAAFHLGTLSPLKHAWVAVDLFFLMSGFVLASAYEKRILERGFWPFIRARLVRLYPMLAVGVAIPLAVYVFVYLQGHALEPPGPTFASAAFSLLYLPSRLGASDGLFPLNGPFWSLSCEMAVNVVYGLLLPWLSNRILGLIVGVAGVAFGYALIATGVDFTPGWANWIWCVPRTAFSFFLGVLIFRLPLPKPRVPIIANMMFCALLLTVSPPPFAVLVGFPLLLICSIQNEQQSRVLSWAGAVSYPLYALHEPLIVPFEHLLSRVGANTMTASFGALAVIVVVSAVALKAWDEPVRRFLGRARWAGATARPVILP
jgi:peptidoglycan/LPS O-acetylase OafA/YrhL